MWKEYFLIQAGNKSELSGTKKVDGIVLQVHHFYGKCNYHLRFSLINGTVLTKNEHFRHHRGKQYHVLDDLAIKIYGADIHEELRKLSRRTDKANLHAIHEELAAAVRRIKQGEEDGTEGKRRQA